MPAQIYISVHLQIKHFHIKFFIALTFVSASLKNSFVNINCNFCTTEHEILLKVNSSGRLESYYKTERDAACRAEKLFA